MGRYNCDCSWDSVSFTDSLIQGWSKPSANYKDGTTGCQPVLAVGELFLARRDYSKPRQANRLSYNPSTRNRVTATATESSSGSVARATGATDDLNWSRSAPLEWCRADRDTAASTKFCSGRVDLSASTTFRTHRRLCCGRY